MCSSSRLNLSLTLLALYLQLLWRDSRADNSNNGVMYRANGGMPEVNVGAGTMPPELDIEVVEITTSSITVHWISNDEDFVGNVTSWTVRYDTGRQVIVSQDLPLEITKFAIDNLQVETSYYICIAVYLLSEYGVRSGSLERGGYLSSSETSTKSTCRTISTIPNIRSDSVLALILTVGAEGFMVVLGVVQWCRAKSRLAKVNKSRAESRDTGTDGDNSSEMLNVKRQGGELSRPVCSIEHRT